MVVCVRQYYYYQPPKTTITEEDNHYAVQHEWSYDGIRWEYTAEIPKTRYDFFKAKPRVSDYGEYVDNPDDDEWMNHLASVLRDEAEDKGWGEFKTVSFALSFVQSLPFTPDNVTTEYDEYPRYPVETIVDGGGDCEDTAILFSSIIRGMGYNTVLLLLKGGERFHMATGVRISQNVVDDWNADYPLAHYESENKTYAYCETTGEGWELGHKPDDLEELISLISV